MQQHIAFFERVEQAARGVERRGRLGCPRLGQQMFESGDPRPRHVAAEVERSIDWVDRFVGGAGQSPQEPEQPSREASRDFEPHRVSLLPGFDHVLHFLGEIEHVIVMDRDVSVARQAEKPAGPDVFARKKRAEKVRDHIFECDAGPPFSLDVWQRNESRQAGRQQDHGVAQRPARRGEGAGDGQAEPWQLRMRRFIGVDRHRREHREDRLAEHFLDVPQLAGSEFAEPELGHAVGSQLRQQVTHREGRLRRHQLFDALADPAELLWERESGDVASALTGACERHQPSDAHHEKLIKVRGGDGQKPESLERREFRTLGLAEHPLVELEPA